jgi:probable F420-dependent oxidoreductase
VTASIALGFPAETTLSPTEIVRCAQHAERAGLDFAWVAEGRGGESFATLSAMAVETQDIGIGAGVLPIFNRSPWLVAMGAASIDELSGGRFTLGLGMGHRAVVEDRHGLTFSRPLQRMAETVAIVRAALTGQIVDYDGEVFRLRGAQLSVEPTRADVPLVIAAMGPKALRLAGEVADGAFLLFASAMAVGEAAEAVSAGRAAAARDPAGFQLIAYVPTCIADDAERAVEASRRLIAYYGRLGHYQTILTRQGFGAPASALARAWGDGDDDAAVRAVTDEMVEALTASGRPEQVTAALRSFAESGLDQVVLYPCPAEGDALTAFLGAVDAAAPLTQRVRPPDPIASATT